MRKIFLALGVIALFAFVMASSVENASANSGLCFLCGSGSSCEQCPSESGKDTSADRKACESKGCKITGYSSCSTAANVKKCK